MKMETIMVVMVLFISAFALQALDLTGVWQCSDGGTYYIRQLGTNVCWYGEASPESPDWANVAYGKIKGNLIELEWADVPKGSAESKGVLTLKIASANRLVLLKETGNFMGSEWTRGKSQED